MILEKPRGVLPIFSIALLTSLLQIAAFESAAGQQQTIHNGRINRSFTEPVKETVAASPETGIIATVEVEEGALVRVGDSLATLNNAVVLESLEIAKARAESTARLEAAKSRLEIVKSQMAAVQRLVGGGHTNKFEVEQKQSEHANALAEYRSAEDEYKLNQLEVKRIQAQLNERIIKSPINGVVTELHREIGESISATEPQYATIVRIEQLKVRFYQTASTLRNIRTGQQIEVTVGEEAIPKTAIVKFVSPVIDPESGLGRIDLLIENQDMSLQSGVICDWKRIVPGQGAVELGRVASPDRVVAQERNRQDQTPRQPFQSQLIQQKTAPQERFQQHSQPWSPGPSSRVSSIPQHTFSDR